MRGVTNDGVQWVRAGWLIDGQGGAPLENQRLGVRHGTLVHVGPAGAHAEVSLDLSHATVLPALIDAHVHLVFSGTRDPRRRTAQLAAGSQETQTAIRAHLRDHWRCGVAAVRDGGDRRGDVGRYRQLQDGSAPPVHVAATCWAWHAGGRYGSMIGQAPSEGVSPEQAAALHLAGCDHLKIIQSGLNSLDRFGYQGRPQFAAEDLQAMVKVAHGAGLPVMVHANGEAAVRMAVEAGCDSIEHGYFMGADNLKRMVDRGTFWVPTAIPMAALAEAPGLRADQRDVARRTLDVHMAQIRQAHRCGVVMALGTDAGSQGVDHGLAVKQELALLMSAGLDVGQAVRCATANGARLLGLTGRGRLLPGWRADFIAVPGPPANLPHSLADMTAICLDGRWYDPKVMLP